MSLVLQYVYIYIYIFIYIYIYIYILYILYKIHPFQTGACGEAGEERDSEQDPGGLLPTFCGLQKGQCGNSGVPYGPL